MTMIALGIGLVVGFVGGVVCTIYLFNLPIGPRF